MFSQCFHSICKDGYPYIAGLGLASIVASAISWGLGLIFFFLTVMCCYFFRDPVRVVPFAKGLILSPADGIVAQIAEGVGIPGDSGDKKNSGESYCRVVIFLNIMDVHVNRFPISGLIESIEYKEGKCSIPSLKSNCGELQRQEFVIQPSIDAGVKGKVAVVQVAGMCARRVVSYCAKDEQILAGNKLGVIKFSSRVDLYFPSSAKVKVDVGQTVIAGESVIAFFGDDVSKESCEFKRI